MDSAVVRSTLQAAVLSATSNILAQSLSAYRSGTGLKLDFLDTTSLICFVVFALLNTPPNFFWQQFLEDNFPAHPARGTPTTPTEKREQPAVGAPAVRPGARPPLSVRNTLIKFSLDQTLGALFNTVAFIAGQGMLRGKTLDWIVAKVRSDTLPLMAAGYKLWPLVSLLSFTVVPPRHRLVFGGIVGVGWGVFLSLFAAH